MADVLGGLEDALHSAWHGIEELPTAFKDVLAQKYANISGGEEVAGTVKSTPIDGGSEHLPSLDSMREEGGVAGAENTNVEGTIEGDATEPAEQAKDAKKPRQKTETAKEREEARQREALAIAKLEHKKYQDTWMKKMRLGAKNTAAVGTGIATGLAVSDYILGIEWIESLPVSAALVVLSVMIAKEANADLIEAAKKVKARDPEKFHKLGQIVLHKVLGQPVDAELSENSKAHKENAAIDQLVLETRMLAALTTAIAAYPPEAPREVILARAQAEFAAAPPQEKRKTSKKNANRADLYTKAKMLAVFAKVIAPYSPLTQAALLTGACLVMTCAVPLTFVTLSRMEYLGEVLESLKPNEGWLNRSFQKAQKISSSWKNMASEVTGRSSAFMAQSLKLAEGLPVEMQNVLAAATAVAMTADRVTKTPVPDLLARSSEAMGRTLKLAEGLPFEMQNAIAVAAIMTHGLAKVAITQPNIDAHLGLGLQKTAQSIFRFVPEAIIFLKYAASMRVLGDAVPPVGFLFDRMSDLSNYLPTVGSAVTDFAARMTEWAVAGFVVVGIPVNGVHKGNQAMLPIIARTPVLNQIATVTGNITARAGEWAEAAVEIGVGVAYKVGSGVINTPAVIVSGIKSAPNFVRSSLICANLAGKPSAASTSVMKELPALSEAANMNSVVAPDSRIYRPHGNERQSCVAGISL